MIAESDNDFSDFSNIFSLEKKLQNELDYEKFNALGEVSKYLKSCTNHLIINTLFLKLAQIFKDLPDVLKIELKEVSLCDIQVLRECVNKFAFSMNINDFLNIFAQSLDSIDSLAKCQVIEIIEVFGPFCVERHDLFHKVTNSSREVFDIFINTKMKYEKKVASHALKTLHKSHSNFSKTLLKNMHSYLHNNENTEEYFRRVVEILPLSSETMNMELLELYLTILSKVLAEIVHNTQKKTNSVKKRKRFTILKIVLTSLMECAGNYIILRE